MDMISKLVDFLKNAHVAAWVVLLYSMVEAWLGSTELVAAGSTLEAVLLGAKIILEFVKNIFAPKI